MSGRRSDLNEHKPLTIASVSAQLQILLDGATGGAR
jgi:hypothetical protein